jgi:putative ABC transport system permease protein
MKPLESVRISWRAITSHKLRSTLTTLGVIIGVGAVIVFMVLGSGFEANILADIEGDEEPTMAVRTQVEPEGGFGVQFSQSPIYTQSDVEGVSNLEGVEYVSPNAGISVAQLQYGDRQLSGGGGFSGGFGVTATTPDKFQDGPFEVVDGEAFESGTNQTVVNEPLVETLEGEIGVGDEITIRFQDGRETTFTVTGIVDDDTGGFNPPTVHVPVDPHYRTVVETPQGTEEPAYAEFTVRAESVEAVDDVKQRVQAYFESDADARQLKNDDQTIVVQTTEDVIDQVTSIIDQLALFLGGIAAISLVVGSIGIANIMIVSVTERTREIGIMKAVGARRRDIMQLFLVESLILGVIGAVVGVLAGLGFGFLGVTLAGWPMAYPVDWIVIAVAVGLFVGVLSGLYPAWRAARVDPIEALRHE